MNEITALDRLVIEINFYSQQSAQSIIELGKMSGLTGRAINNYAKGAAGFKY